MRYITIALAKGRLAKKALEIFEHIGVTCDEMKDENTRKLIFTNEELGIRFFLAKPSDVPTYVEYGAADIGIVGINNIPMHILCFCQRRRSRSQDHYLFILSHLLCQSLRKLSDMAQILRKHQYS